MLESSDVIAFVATSDVDRARHFYETTLGLRLVDENQYACVFDANGIQLRVTVVEEVSPAPYTVLGWSVTDIADAVRHLAERGVSFARYDGMEQDTAGVWRSPSGAQIAWFKDPDGNTLSLTQFQEAHRLHPGV
jgi:catechol 2,3-dioxygenase-like lactoylglutathione lyase family enzyme